MRPQELTAAVAMNDAEMPSEVSSRLSTSVGKSKSNFRLFLFTALAVLACFAALANVASAATPSGEDQYIEKAPSGGGDSRSSDAVDAVDANGDGVVSEAEVKKAAKKNKKKAKAKKDDEGATGATAAVVTSTPAPPAVESVATAAKFGPFSRNTALALLGLVLVAGIGLLVSRNRAGAAPPMPPQ